MLLTFGLLDEAQVEALREKGYAIFFAKVSQTDSDWLEEALRVKVNKAKDGDANFCLFVNVDSDGFVDALAEGNHVDPEVVERCMGNPNFDEFDEECFDGDNPDDAWEFEDCGI